MDTWTWLLWPVGVAPLAYMVGREIRAAADMHARAMGNLRDQLHKDLTEMSSALRSLTQ
jgi:hypothetical protein